LAVILACDASLAKGLAFLKLLEECNMRRYVTSLLFLPLLAFAAEPPANEKVCRACHGVNGAAPIMSLYPKLNGQNKDYLVASLKAYKAGQRQGTMAALMAGQAAALSDDDILRLADYYASQP